MEENHYQFLIGAETRNKSVSEAIKKVRSSIMEMSNRYFDINIAENGSFKFVQNLDKIDACAENQGFFCLISSCEFDGETALQIYRRKDCVEKTFDDIKNQIDMKRLKTWNSTTTDGKMFCAFVALIAVSEIINKTSNFLRKNSMSRAAMFKELDKIRIIFTSDEKQLLNPLSKLQRDILALFSLSIDHLITFISK